VVDLFLSSLAERHPGKHPVIIHHRGADDTGFEAFIINRGPGDEIAAEADAEPGQAGAVDLRAAVGVIQHRFQGHFRIRPEELLFQGEQALPRQIDGQEIITPLAGPGTEVEPTVLGKGLPPPIITRVCRGRPPAPPFLK
jgi:hypothetical protein